MMKEFEDLITEEETKLKETKSSIEMKRQVKEAKRVWEKKYEQAKFLSSRLSEELKEVKFKNMLKMARQTEHIQREHDLKIEQSKTKAKTEADQEIKALEKEIHRKNSELNNDAVGQ